MRGQEGENNDTGRVESLDHILAHDVANYLNVIQGNVELLLDSVEDAGNVERLNTIKRQATAANALLETVGGMTRGGSRGEFEGVDVSQMVRCEIDRLQSIYPDTEVFASVDEGVMARADELVMSVFVNLFENAIHHTDASHPAVDVSVFTEDGMAVVSIEDNGPGIPRDVRDQLLGHGLAHPTSGINIIRTLVDRYNGTISLESGQDGTSVTVELPCTSD